MRRETVPTRVSGKSCQSRLCDCASDWQCTEYPGSILAKQKNDDSTLSSPQGTLQRISCEPH